MKVIEEFESLLVVGKVEEAILDVEFLGLVNILMTKMGFKVIERESEVKWSNVIEFKCIIKFFIYYVIFE